MTDFDTILNEPDEDVEETETVETPEVSEPVTPEPEAEITEPVVEEPAAEEAREDGFKQDARGVWHRPDGTIASKDEVAKITAESAPVDTVETPAVPVTPEAPKVEPVATVPFRYRALSANHELAGTSFDPSTGKLTVETPETLGQIKQALNAFHLLPEIMRERDLLKAKASQQGPSEAKAGKLVEALSAIIENPDEEAAIAQFFDLRQKFPTLKSQAEVDYWRSQVQGARQEPERAETASPLPAPDIALSTTREHLEHFKLDSEFRALTEDDWKQIDSSLARKPYAFVRPATADDAAQYGVQIGELVFDTDAMADDIKSFAQNTSKAREAEANARKAKEAAAFNRKQVVPTPSVTPARPKAPRATVPATKTEKSWDERYKEAWSDEDDEE